MINKKMTYEQAVSEIESIYGMFSSDKQQALNMALSALKCQYYNEQPEVYVIGWNAGRKKLAAEIVELVEKDSKRI